MLIRKRLIDKVTKLAPLTKSVSHRYRLAILYLLTHGSKDTFELADHLMIKEPLLVHHLKTMKDAGWVKRIRTGRRVSYELQEVAIFELKKFLDRAPFFKNLSRLSR